MQDFATIHTVDGRNPAPPKILWNDDYSANTKQIGSHVSKCRISQPPTVGPCLRAVPAESAAGSEAEGLGGGVVASAGVSACGPRWRAALALAAALRQAEGRFRFGRRCGGGSRGRAPFFFFFFFCWLVFCVFFGGVGGCFFSSWAAKTVFGSVCFGLGGVLLWFMGCQNCFWESLFWFGGGASLVHGLPTDFFGECCQKCADIYRFECGSKVHRRGKPQVLVHVSTYQCSILVPCY